MKNPTSETARFRHAFSLLELLVVIAVIAIVVSILLPTIAGARGAARSAVCLSNLRQLHMAVFQYTTDHDGFFPGEDALATDHTRWTENMKMAGDNPDIFGSYETDKAPYGVLQCPSIESRRSDTVVAAKNNDGSFAPRYGTDYGMNVYLVLGGSSKGTPYTYQYTTMKNPGFVLLAGDSGGFIASPNAPSDLGFCGTQIQGGNSGEDSGRLGCCERRHLKKTWNGVFVDGHTEAFAEVPSNSKYWIPASH